ncbi:MAG: hypothetical protein VX768_10365 [Planctomycetota bacterium]|nr:hypothetical protein [Planctomycetota bacterium]
MYRPFETTLGGLALATLVVIFSSSSLANGQEYDVMPLNAKFDLAKIQAEPEANGDPKKAQAMLNQRISQAQRASRSSFQPNATLNDTFKTYYREVVVPNLTRYDRASLQSLTTRYQNLFKDFGTKIRNRTAQGYLVVQVYFPMFGSIVEGNYHPLVRYNALLAIGKLDEITGKQNIAVPKPYRDSLKYLIEKYNGFTDPKLHYLKYGAFKGIARIAAIGFQSPNTTNADAAKPIFAALLGAKPADLNEDLFRSMQRSAVEVLGLLGDPANGDALASLIADPKTPVWTRAEAAIAFSKIKAPNYDANKIDATSTEMAKLMHDVLRAEAKELDRIQKRIAILAARQKEVGAERTTAGAGSSGSSGGRGGSSADDRSDGLMSGGGGSGSMMPGGGSGGAGSGSMMPGGGSGGSGSSRGGSSRNNGGTQLSELPAYRITQARRRLKTVSSSLIRAYGDSQNSVEGLRRWANGNNTLSPKIDAFKKLMAEADKAAEVGLGENSFEESLTRAMVERISNVADQIADRLGMTPTKAEDAPKAAKKAAKDDDDAFLKN